MPQLLALSGAMRAESFNHRLVLVMAEGARAQGVEVQVLRWQDYTLPVFSEDLEQSPRPAEAYALKAAFRAAHGFLIATPEYNGGIPGGFKNALDWISRSLPGDPPGSVLKGKPVVIAGATTGRWGAVRSIRQLREVMGYLGAIVLPDSLSVNEADKAFDAEGRLLDAKAQQMALGTGAAAAKIVRSLYAD